MYANVLQVYLRTGAKQSLQSKTDQSLAEARQSLKIKSDRVYLPELDKVCT